MPQNSIRPPEWLEYSARDRQAYEYNCLVDTYVRLLSIPHTSPHELERLENEIAICQIDLGYFQNVSIALSGVRQLRTNQYYDNGNLTHRFTALYVGRYLVSVEGYNALVSNRPLGTNCYNPLRHRLTTTDLGFLSILPRTSGEPQASSYEETMPYGQNQQSEPIDFTINGQKIKLYLVSRYIDDSRRYVTTIDINIASDRMTNRHRIVSIERHEPHNVFLHRIPQQRPAHGLRFVHLLNNNHIVVKEIK